LLKIRLIDSCTQLDICSWIVSSGPIIWFRTKLMCKILFYAENLFHRKLSIFCPNLSKNPEKSGNIRQLKVTFLVKIHVRHYDCEMKGIVVSRALHLISQAKRTLQGFQWIKNPTKLVPMLWFLKIFSPKNLAKILAFFAQTTAIKNENDIRFWEKRQFFRRKLAKITENCDQNIDPLDTKIKPIFLLWTR
jgi:hypothetical protein